VKRKKPGPAPRPEAERLVTQLGVRADPATVRRLDALAAKLGLLTRAEVARECLLIGLESAERDPHRLLTHAAKRKR
jgi:hypothetical protein